MRSGNILGGLALMALAGSSWAQVPPALLAPPPASVCTSPTAPTEPGNVHMFPGRWWNPQRNGIGWDFFYGEGQRSMYLTWFTYDDAGRPVWLHGENKELQFNAVTGERTWQSNLYVANWTFSYLGRTLTPVGSVSVTFPNQTTTRAAVRWRWNQNSTIDAVGNSTYDECLYDTFREQRLLGSQPANINQAFSANWFYRGIPNDPLVGWGVDLLVDLNPSNSRYIETAAAAIFDVNGRPVWLQSEDDWGTNAPPDDTLTLLGVGNLRYIRYTPVAGVHPAVTVCENPSSVCGPDADHDATSGPDTYGQFARKIEDAANGQIHLTAAVPSSVTGLGAVDWPPPNNVPALAQTVPAMRFDANHVIVDKSVCRVLNENDLCTFQVSWSTNDPNAQIRRLDLNNGGNPSSFASGLSAVQPDPLPLGARVQYEITYRYNGTGVLTTLRTPEVRVLLDGAISDANVQNIACTPNGNNGCDLYPHDPTTGAIAGEASTDGGAATYSMPIAVPPGRNGVAPKLALTYSSRSGNGIAGLGWSLSGLSAIHRCPRTAAQDGVGNVSAVNLAGTDALCLDGQRLVRINSNGSLPPESAPLPYGVADAYYRTEINDFSRVTQYGGDLASGSTCFKVERKSGEVSYYGGVPIGPVGSGCTGGGSRQVPFKAGSQVPLSWNIEREEDASGNSIVYTYSSDSAYGAGEKLLQSISYTGKGGVAGDRQVAFTYEQRPAADQSRSYMAGAMIERTQRLKRIASSVAGAAVNTYTLTYTNPLSGAQGDLHSGRSALQSIRQCATGGEDNGGAEVCLPETVVAWNDLPPDYVLRPLNVAGLPAVAPTSGGGTVDRQIKTIGDLDGDGVREVLVRQFQADQQFHTWLVKQNADRAVTSVLDITSIAGSLLYFDQGMQTDFDGDGRADLVAADPGNYLQLYRWNSYRGANFAATPAAAFTTVTLNGVAPGEQLVSTDDIDGDGHADLILRRQGDSCTSLAVEAGTLDPKVGAAHILCYYRNTTTAPGSVSFATGVQIYGWQHNTLEGGLSAVGDFNGDGITDMVITTKTAQPGGEVQAITTVLLSRQPGQPLLSGCTPTPSPTSTQWAACSASAMNLPTTDTGYRTPDAVMRWHDVNGDGLVDLLYALPGDCTNMGHACGRGSWAVQIANGRNFNAAVPIVGNTDALLMTTGMEHNRLRYAGLLPAADLDSDGKQDLLYPVGLAARQCMAVNMKYEVPNGDDNCGEYDRTFFGESPETEMQICEATVWVCGNDPAADIAGTTSPYQLPYEGDMPVLDYEPAITTDNLYSVRTHRANFTAADQSLYYMAGLRFIPTAGGFEAQSFSLDSSAGTNRAPHRVAMTLNDIATLNTAEDLYGDGLTDLTTRAGCFNQGISAAYCHFVGDGIVGPQSLATSTGPNTAPVLVNVSDLNNGLRTFVNENVGIAENANSSPTLPEMVESVTNGLGDKTVWWYFPLASRADRSASMPLHIIRENGYVDASHFYFQSTMPVVGTMTSSSGVGTPEGFRSWRYGYSEPMYNRLGRGFQGFRAILREQVVLQADLPRAARELTQFHQKFPLTGLIEFTRTGVPTGGGIETEDPDLLATIVPFTDVSYAWGCRLTDRNNCPTTGAPSVWSFDYPFLNQQVTTSYDPAQAEQGHSKKVAQSTNNQYQAGGSATAAGWDAFGNLLYSHTLASDFAEASGSIAFVTSKQTQHIANYTNLTAALWWPGKLTDTTDTVLPVQYGAAHPLPADVIPTAQVLHTLYGWNDDRTPASVTVESGDPNLQTEKLFTYPTGADNYGLPIAISDRFFDTTIGGTVTRTAQTVYDTDGYFPVATIDAVGVQTEVVFRARDGQVQSTKLPTNVELVNGYDAFGRLFRTETLRAEAGKAPLVQAAYTAWNRCIGGSCPGVGNGGANLSEVGSTAEKYAAYRVTTVQNGSPTKVVWYDLLGREVKSAARGFDGTFVATLSEYDRMGTLAKKSVPFFLSSANAAAPFASTFNYDRAGRITEKTSPDGEITVGTATPSSGRVTSSYLYAGNRTTVQVRNSRNLCTPANLCPDVVRYSGVLGLMRTDDALAGVTRFWADGAGRPLAIADANVNAAYSGQIPAGKVTRASYNVLGHRTTASDPNQGSWNFVYNGAGELVKQTDARNIVTLINRDLAGRPTWQTSTLPAWGTQPAENYRDEWTYQPSTGLVEDVKRCLETPAPTSCRLYNPSTNVQGNTVWRESYVYDHGRVASVNAMQKVGASELTYPTSFHYDGNFGREKAVEYASGLRVQRIFTKYGALRDVIDADTGQRFWGIGGADAFGNTTRQDYGNGVVGEYIHDSISGRAVRKQWSRVVNGVPQILDSIDYGYDVLANLTAQRRQVPGVASANATENYTYDKLQRLTASSVPGSGNSVGYDYDALGNLTRKSDYSLDAAGAYQYAAAGTNGCGPNVATTILMPTGAGYDRLRNFCDANGNVIKSQPADAANAPLGGPREIRYDASNRPRNIIDPSAPSSPTALFTYAPDGRRVYELLTERYYPNPGDIGQTRSRYIVQGPRGYQVELSSDAGGWSSAAAYRHEIGDVSVILRTVPGQGAIRDVAFKIQDRLGSPLGVMDKDGLFRQRSENGYINNSDTRLSFGAFGAARDPGFQPRVSTGEMPGRMNLTPATRLGFTGHEHLDSLGLIHMNGRVYDHRLGRFLSVDPFIQFPANSQSLNPYSYIMNNPMAGLDPTGYQADIANCTPMTGTHICGATTGAENGQTSYTASVTSTDPKTGEKTTTYFRAGVADGRVVSYTFLSKTVDNGANRQAGSGNRNESVSDIESATKTPGQVAMQQSADFGLKFGEYGGKFVEALAPIDPEHPYLSVLLLPVGGKATKEGVHLAGGSIFRRMEKEVKAVIDVERQIAKGERRGKEIPLHFSSLNSARKAAERLSQLGDDAVNFVQEIGPFKGLVTGRMSPDGSRGWRLDLDWSAKKGLGPSGFHVNWWRDNFPGAKNDTMLKGANIIDEADQHTYWELANHLIRQQ